MLGLLSRQIDNNMIMIQQIFEIKKHFLKKLKARRRKLKSLYDEIAGERNCITLQLAMRYGEEHFPKEEVDSEPASSEVARKKQIKDGLRLASTPTVLEHSELFVGMSYFFTPEGFKKLAGSKVELNWNQFCSYLLAEWKPAIPTLAQLQLDQ